VSPIAPTPPEVDESGGSDPAAWDVGLVATREPTSRPYAVEAIAERVTCL
jgi:hypothetical protein